MPQNFHELSTPDRTSAVHPARVVKILNVKRSLRPHKTRLSTEEIGVARIFSAFRFPSFERRWVEKRRVHRGDICQSQELCVLRVETEVLLPEKGNVPVQSKILTPDLLNKYFSLGLIVHNRKLEINIFVSRHS